MPDYSDVAAVFPLVDYTIVGVDTGTEEFVIDGDQTERFQDGDEFSVVDSTGNDGAYTVASTSYSEVNDETTITVNEDITDATVDGTVIHREVADSLPITESHDDAADRDAAAPEEYAGAHGQRIANELKALGKTVGEGLGLEVVNGGGLVVYYTGGKVLKGSGTPVFVSTGKLTMTDNDDNYVEVDIVGTVSSNLVGFTTGKYPLAIVTTLAGVITNINDTRSVIYLAEFAEANLDAFGPSFNAPTELTIASDAVTRTQGVHRIDTEGDAAADDLSTISGTAADYLLYIRSENAARVVTLKDGIGNLDLNGQDIVLDDPGIFIGLIYDSVISKWVLAGGGGGGVAAPSVDNRLVTVDGTQGGIKQAAAAILNASSYLYNVERVAIATGSPPTRPLQVEAGGVSVEGIAITGTNYPAIRCVNLVNAAGGEILLESSTKAWAMYLQGSELRFWDGADRVKIASGGAATFTQALSALGIITASGGHSLGPPAELTIAAGVVTVTKGYHKIDTEADAATDDLVTINGGVDGETLVIRAQNSTRTIIVKDGGNLAIAGDFTMDNIEDTMMLIYDSFQARWLEISRSDNGA